MIIVEVIGDGGGKIQLGDWRRVKVGRYPIEGTPRDLILLFLEGRRERLPEVVTHRVWVKTVPEGGGLTHRVSVSLPMTVWFETELGLVASWGRITGGGKPFIYRTEKHLGKKFQLAFYAGLEVCVLRDGEGNSLHSSISYDHGSLYVMFEPMSTSSTSTGKRRGKAA